jgi:hypothetical protein
MKLSLTLACLALACSPAPALAKTKTHAPPGNSGVQEYLEVVPGGGGNRPAAKLKGSPHALNGKDRGALRSYGRDGQAAANLAAVTSDPGSQTRSRARRAAKKGAGVGAAAAANRALMGNASDSDDGGVFDSLKRVATRLGGDGLGVGLPLLLLVLLIGGILLGRRRRGRTSET